MPGLPGMNLYQGQVAAHAHTLSPPRTVQWLAALGKSLCPAMLLFLYWMIEDELGTNLDKVRIVTVAPLGCCMDSVR